MINNQVEKTNVKAEKEQQGTRFPKAILSVSRQELGSIELGGVELTVKQGLTEEAASLPLDLQGHLFLVSPAGTLDSPPLSTDSSSINSQVVLPSANGWTPLFNGDGMVHRFDFDSGKARLTNRIMKTPCYYADLATNQAESAYKDLKFRNLGFGRASFKILGAALGFRNQLNTAFVPFKLAGDNDQRLLVTWDTGRPFEIDPLTLKLIAPVGGNEQWQGVFKIPGVIPAFKQIVATAHAAFDPHGKGEVFTVNVGKSISTVLALSHSVFPPLKIILRLTRKLSHSLWFRMLDHYFHLLLKFLRLEKIYQRVYRWFARDNFVHLLHWSGQDVGDIKQWELVLDNGSPIKIEETLHQMGITEDYLVLADTSFKFDLEEALPYSSVRILEDLEQEILERLDFPESPYTNVYIVRRADLKSDRQQITAKKVQIPLSMAHYLVDYNNPDGKITLHTEHMCATDPSETIRKTDSSIFDVPEIDASLKGLGGSIAGAMDVSRLGCHVIDVEQGKLDSSSYAFEREYNWSTSFYAYRDDMPTRKFEDIYWNSWGCWTDTLSQHIYNLYKNYANRTVPLEHEAKEGEKPLEQYFREGVPSSICRLHIDRTTGKPQLEQQDRFVFPKNYLGTSIQFIPKAGTQGTTEGYIVCVVIHSDILYSAADGNWSNNSEIWVLDGENLKGGVLYRLSHPQLNLGFTLHTTWLASISQTASTRSYDIRQDYDPILKEMMAKSAKHNNSHSHQAAAKIAKLFEEEIYPHFDSE